MTRALDDILRQPEELAGVLDRMAQDDFAAIHAAVAAFDPARPVLIVGIGSSYNAAIAIAVHFQAAARAAFAVDASEMLHFMPVPEGANALVLSRSGRSVEIVRVMDRLEAARARVVAITNTPDSPLAARAGTVLHLGAAFDHNVSFTMYSALGLVGGLLAAASAGGDLAGLAAALGAGLEANGGRMDAWRRQIDASGWLEPVAPTYFLARGPGVATCHEARLLWEEVAKAPATALPTGGFRHGSQEFIRPGVRIGLWLDPAVLTREDAGLIGEIETEGGGVMAIGEDPGDAGATLALAIAPMPPGWQFLADIMPVQLASERLSALRGEDPDNFRFCSFVVEAEDGLGGKRAARAG